MLIISSKSSKKVDQKVSQVLGNNDQRKLLNIPIETRNMLRVNEINKKNKKKRMKIVQWHYDEEDGCEKCGWITCQCTRYYSNGLERYDKDPYYRKHIMYNRW